MTTQTSVVTLTETADQATTSNSDTNEQLALNLRLNTATNERHVTFTADTVDNEHMGRLKSNCCCIYVKPRQWDDPSTWEQDENETEHCRGHTIPIDQGKSKPENDSDDKKPSCC
ncbi:hypothetical protein M3Y97_00312500 [Aphelenchoides bicaudatus]|nr:hypothetical protein M3Y97_00312500 [Aphelenchoides bicaudatus]